MVRYRIRRLVLVAGASAGLSAVALTAPVGLAQTDRWAQTPAAARPAEGAAEALPMTGITLYRSGVASIERRGRVNGDADVALRFGADQINDVLKSMLVVDLDGGRVEAIGYESREPLDRRLSSFAIDLSGDSSMMGLLRQLRGAPVELETTSGVVRGSVVGVETRPAPTPEGNTEHRPFAQILTADGAVRGVDLTSAQGFRILDERLASEFAMALAAIGERRDEDTKRVDLRFRGAGEREVAVAYVQEAPVWKTSYRLMLPERSEDGRGAGLLQGWAIVENTTDEDWTDVRLSLVAGRPVSFTMDLYEPLYLGRPEVAVPVMANVGPQVYGRVLERADKALAGRGAGEERARILRSQAAPAPATAAELMDSDVAVAPAFVLESVMNTAAAGASAQSVGEVVEYRLDRPVTIERQRSAMLPILGGAVEARRVSIYAYGSAVAGAGGFHPMRGVEMTNAEGSPLMAGPISVYDGERYAGDAQIGFVSGGETRLLSYAVDLDVSANSEVETDSDVRRVRIVNGAFEETRLSRQTVTHRFASTDTVHPRTIVVEQPRLVGWELVAPDAPADETGGAYRFETTLDPGGQASLAVTQERTERRRVGLTSYPVEQLLAWSQRGRVSQEVVDAVREAGRLRGLIEESERRAQSLDRERDEIARDQSRIRDNMSRLDRTGELYQRYVRKLGEQESRIEDLVESIDEARASLESRRAAYEAYVSNLSVE